MNKAIAEAVDKYRSLILDVERYVWEHPETGYREMETSRYLEEKFESLGYELTRAEGIPGFYTVLDTGKKGPEILVLGELDSLICPNHKEAVPDTGYVHVCGHNAQVAALVGIAAALKEPGICDGLCGKIRICAVPAEELIELGYREELIKKGIIKYYCGKTEFLSRGYFEGADIAFMVHSAKDFSCIKGMTGCIAKTVRYKGQSAHAGGEPWNGKNALYAATQGLSAANAIRETFNEADLIRFHPIITHGGEAVNAIPELGAMESFVRGKTFDAITDANKRLNRALCGAALSLDANVEIIDRTGYSPLNNNDGLIELTKEAADWVIPEENFKVYDYFSTGSTDMGDLSCLMPVVHPNAGGITGKSHGEDFYIDDPERACVKSAKMQVAMIYLLLKNGGERAKSILSDFKPLFNSNDEFFEYLNNLNHDGDRIAYNSDGTATVRI